MVEDGRTTTRMDHLFFFSHVVHTHPNLEYTVPNGGVPLITLCYFVSDGDMSTISRTNGQVPIGHRQRLERMRGVASEFEVVPSVALAPIGYPNGFQDLPHQLLIVRPERRELVSPRT